MTEATARLAAPAAVLWIARTLEATAWNRSQAARWLKVDYKTLLHKIDRYGLSPGRLPQP